MAGGPPHGPGKLFKMKCTDKSGSTVNFSSDSNEAVQLTVSQDDADYFKVGQEYTIDFRPLPPKRDGE